MFVPLPLAALATQLRLLNSGSRCAGDRTARTLHERQAEYQVKTETVGSLPKALFVSNYEYDLPNSARDAGGRLRTESGK